MSSLYTTLTTSISAFIDNVSNISSVFRTVFSFLPPSTLAIFYTGFGFLIIVCLYKGIRG